MTTTDPVTADRAPTEVQLDLGVAGWSWRSTAPAYHGPAAGYVHSRPPGPRHPRPSLAGQHAGGVHQHRPERVDHPRRPHLHRLRPRPHLTHHCLVTPRYRGRRPGRAPSSPGARPPPITDKGNPMPSSPKDGPTDARVRRLVPDHPEWPMERLRCLTVDHEPRTSDRGPEDVDQGLPAALWVQGRQQLDQLTDRAVAIIGTHTATPLPGEVTGFPGSERLGEVDDDADGPRARRPHRRIGPHPTTAVYSAVRLTLPFWKSRNRR